MLATIMGLICFVASAVSLFLVLWHYTKEQHKPGTVTPDGRRLTEADIKTSNNAAIFLWIMGVVLTILGWIFCHG